jgi:hypothetical protein
MFRNRVMVGDIHARGETLTLRTEETHARRLSDIGYRGFDQRQTLPVINTFEVASIFGQSTLLK